MMSRRHSGRGYSHDPAFNLENHPPAAAGNRESPEGEVLAEISRGLAASVQPPRSDLGVEPIEQGPDFAPAAGPVRTHDAVAVCVLSRRSGDHGRGPGTYPEVFNRRAGLRRLSPDELRAVCHARAAADLRHQRL